MPALIGADNFTHRDFSANRHGLGSANGERGYWSVVNRLAGISFDTAKIRDGRGFMKIVEDGITATNARKGIAAGVQVLSFSAYFIVDTAPSVNSLMFWGGGPVNSGQLLMNSDGTIHWNLNGTGDQSFVGSKADGQPHRLQVKIDTSGTTFTVDVTLDGVTGTQAARSGQTAADMTSLGIGSFTATHSLTFWIQDLVWSATPTDYPIGGIDDHVVRSLNPSGDGTHAASITAGDFDMGDGTDILTTTTNAFLEIDDYLTGSADSSTYIQDTAGASTEYTEHQLEDTDLTTIWDVFGYVATFASSSTACTLTARVVDSLDATLTDVLADEDVSNTALNYNVAKIAAPGGSWDQAEVNGLKIRIGLSTNVAQLPRCSAVMLQVAGKAPPPPTGASFPARRAVVA
jgi:hypothetical protein